MCSIVGSFNTERVIELAKLNEYRGTHSHSICYIHRYTMEITHLQRSLGPLDYLEIDVPPDNYCIVHQQAPTTDNKDLSNIHPAQINNKLLWHNGIVKDREIKRLQDYLECSSTWDTKLILRQLVDYDTPENIDGTFSCVYVDDYYIIVFRNEISPLYYDSDLTISSTKFDNSISLPPNKMFYLQTSLCDESLITIREFNTVENPYYFGD